MLPYLLACSPEATLLTDLPLPFAALQVAANTDKLLLCSMPAADRRQVADMLTSTLSTLQLAGKGVDVPTARAMLSMLASAYDVSTCQDACAAGASGRHLLSATASGFNTQPTASDPSTVDSISSNFDSLAQLLLENLAPGAPYISTGSDGLFVSVGLQEGQDAPGFVMAVGADMVVNGTSNSSVANSASNAVFKLNSQVQAPCAANASLQCTDQLVNIAAEMAQRPELFISVQWQQPSAEAVENYTASANPAANPPLVDLELLTAAVKWGFISDTVGLADGGVADVSCVNSSCDATISLPLQAAVDSGKQLVCLQIEEGGLVALASWKVVDSNTDNDITIVTCSAPAPGTYLVGQFTPPPPPPARPLSDYCLAYESPVECNTTLPVMNATLLVAGGLANCMVRS